MDFTKFSDSPTIYTGSGQGAQAFSNPNDFFSAGGKQDFSNVTTVNSATPSYLKSAGVYSPVSAKPSGTIPSSSLNQPPSTQFDLIGALNKNLANQDSIINNINSYFTPSDQELQAQQQYNDLQNKTDSTNLDALAGINKIQDQAIPMDFITGQQASVQRNANLALQTLGIQQQAAARNLQNLQANRQTKLQAAQFMYDANRNSLQDTLSLYKQTAPENLMTKVDDTTGNIIVVTKNPVTGQITNQIAGNVNATSPFYKFEGDPTIYDRNGKAYSDVASFVAAGGDPRFANVQTINPNAPQEKDAVQRLMLDYPDAGISLRDTLDTAQTKLNQSALYRNKIRLLGAGGGPSSPTPQTSVTNSNSGFVGPINPNVSLSPTSQAVAQNPALYSTLTPTQKGQVLPELQKAGFDVNQLTEKQLSDTAIQAITETQNAIDGLNSLKQKLKDNEQYLGPISGLQALNPWSKAKQVQADINRVKQQVGKTLEGGVLRKEDEDKYKQILATITDTPSTAQYKLDALITDIQNKMNNYKTNQASAGRKVDSSSSSLESLRNKYNY